MIPGINSVPYHHLDKPYHVFKICIDVFFIGTTESTSGGSKISEMGGASGLGYGYKPIFKHESSMSTFKEDPLEDGAMRILGMSKCSQNPWQITEFNIYNKNAFQ